MNQMSQPQQPLSSIDKVQILKHGQTQDGFHFRQ
uniref:Uncharacterized protein n=1 Tax=Rhizophora mucronata TaxID=61149 RepID=A0A2P2NLF3_RHIMU